MRRRALEELDGNTWVASRRSNRPRVARVGVLVPFNTVDARDENSSLQLTTRDRRTRPRWRELWRYASRKIRTVIIAATKAT